MSILPAAILTAIAVPALGNPAMQSASTKPSKARPKVAVFTFSGGYKHDVLELAEKTIAQLTKKHDDFEVVLHHQYRQEAGKLDLSMINADYLEQFAGILFYTTSGEKDKDLLTAEQRKALMDAIKGGTGFIGIHSAADTFYKWPEYGEMIGAYFDGHPWNADSPPVTLKVEDNEHPAGNPIGSFWFLQEEIYQFRAPYDRKKLHVLLSLDTDATDMTVPGIKRKDGDFAVAWSKYHGKGRVFYTALGHRADVWENELFQNHLRGGIRWAIGRLNGNPPSPGAAPEQLITTASGLKYRDIVVGDGPLPRRFQSVDIHYHGWLIDGTKFDSSIDRGKPFNFTLGVGAVIAGWEEGVAGMHVGGKRKLVIPPGLGYGIRGYGDSIPPNATLVFEIELLAAKKSDAVQQP